jgi:chloramphenicol 3-O phosphotransferase
VIASAVVSPSPPRRAESARPEEVPPVKPGTIIHLNGASSSGKTSIARVLQESLDEFYLHTGIDQFLAMCPRDFFVYSDGVDPAGVEGELWVVSPEDPPTLREIRVGPAGLRLLDGMYPAIAALAAAGNNVIVEDGILARETLRLAVTILRDFDVLFVGVRCPLEVIERREQERGDRIRGLARTCHGLVHAHAVYDLEVDTSVSSPQQCAATIKDALQRRPQPSAYAQLAAALDAMPA